MAYGSAARHGTTVSGVFLVLNIDRLADELPRAPSTGEAPAQ